MKKRAFMVKFNNTVNSKDVDALLDDFEELYKSEFDIMVLTLITELKQATPIDTGKARGGWEYQLTKSDIAYITNEVEYIGYLNDGHSQQAPAYFVEQTVHRLGFEIIG